MRTGSSQTRCAVWRILILASISGAALGQLYTGSLSGMAIDPSGAPVAQASVTLTGADRNTRETVITDNTGRYLFRSLPPGKHSMRVDATGFDPLEIPNLLIDVGENVSLNAKLTVAVRRDSILVAAKSPLIRPDDATIGLIVDRRTVNDLPLINRNPFDLAFLAPGVSQAPGTTYGNGISTPGFVTNFISDGSRNAQADLLLDGVSIANSDNNPGIQKALYVPPVEAIQEFKIQQANFSAEFGNSGGTIVNVATRSGTNQYHGELFEFLRNNDLNANTFFANAGGLPQPHLTRNDFGGTVGGPVLKDRLFFFFDFNGIRALTGQTSSLAGVPDAAERSGDFGELCARSGGSFNAIGVCSNPAGQIYDPYTGKPDAQNNATGRLPISFNNLASYVSPGNPNIPFGLGNLPARAGNLIDPVGAKLIQAFPLPNLKVGMPAYDPYHNWVSTGASPLDQQSFDIKLDEHPSDRDILSVRFSHEWDSGQNPNFFGSVYDTNTQGPTKHAALVGQINYTHTFDPKTLMNVSVGYAHNWYPTDGVAASFGGYDPAKVLGMPPYIDTSGFMTPPSIWLFGAYGCSGFNGCVGGQAWSVLRFASETGHLLGSVGHVSGRHEIRVGAELRRHRLNFMQAGTPNGLFGFTASATASGLAGTGGDALASLMTGYVDNWSRYEIPAFTATQNYQVGMYFQDNWRLTPRLTLNLGFRYDVETWRRRGRNGLTK